MSVTPITANPNSIGQIMSDFKSLNRVKTEIPVIKMGYECIARMISSIKESSSVVEWSLDKASSSVDQMVNYPLPYVKDQLLVIDQLLCTSLDLTELNLPVLTKTPQEMYEGGVEYVMGIVTPFTDWVDMELLPPAEYYVDRYLPELDLNRKTEHANDEKDSRACQLAVKLSHRIKQHAYAELKYLGTLMYSGFKESILLMKIFIFDPKLLPKTFLQIWKKLGDGITPEEAAKSLLLAEMGCIRLRNGTSSLIKMVEISGESAKCYIEMFMIYISENIDYVVDILSRVVNPVTKNQIIISKNLLQNENRDTEIIGEDTNKEDSTQN